MSDQLEKTRHFRLLHERNACFVMPNAWDAGTARILTALGFEAIATTSLGLVNSLGRADHIVTLEETLENCRQIASATHLPVNADLENCFADDPKEAAETIRLAAETGIAGGSIEDYTGDSSQPIYDFNLAVERVQAAVEMAQSLPIPFVLTARAENLLHGVNDLDDTIKRLQSFEAAGADVLFAPGLKTLDEIRTVLSAIEKPFNVVTGWLDRDITISQLAATGATRISVGGALSRLALANFIQGARSLKEEGSIAWMNEMADISDLQNLFSVDSDS